MADEDVRRLEYTTLVLVLVVVVAGAAAVLSVVGTSQFDPGRMTVAAVVVGTLLVVGAIALPAYLFAGWQAAEEEATGERRR